MNPPWTTDAASVSLPRIAEELRYTLSRRSLSACPACGEGSNGSCKAFRGKGDRDRWHCHRCDAGGDVIDLVAYALTGDKLPRGHSPASEAVRAWFASRGWCAPPDSYTGPPPTPKPRTSPADKALKADPPPPVREVRALLRACRPTPEVPEVHAWLVSRLGSRAPLESLVGRGIVGALPEGASLPRWATFGKQDWTALGYRAIVPLYDASGAVASVRARHIANQPRLTWVDRKGRERTAPKALPPQGHTAAGFVMADAVGQLMLRTGEIPTWWPGRTFDVVIAEGEPQFLAWCVAMQGAGAVFGIFNGSWTPELAARVPKGARVEVCANFDDAGNAYFDAIRSSLSDRCRVQRWRPAYAA